MSESILKNKKTGPIGIESFARITDFKKPENATKIVKQYVNLQYNNKNSEWLNNTPNTKFKRQPDKIP